MHGSGPVGGAEGGPAARARWAFDPIRYADVSDLAAMLGVSRRTVWRMVAAGSLPAPLRKGRRAAFDLDAVVSHAEQVDPWLSCYLAGETGRRRGY